MQNMPLVASVHSIVVVGVYVAFLQCTATAYSCLLTPLEQYLNTLYTPTCTTTILLTETTKRHILLRYMQRREH